MFHSLTIGHFDRDGIDRREVLDVRPLTDDELDAIQQRVREQGFTEDIREFLDERGVLVVPWLSWPTRRLAAATARAAHELFGAVVADVSHAALIDATSPGL
jgi:hypothetical protein